MMHPTPATPEMEAKAHEIAQQYGGGAIPYHAALMALTVQQKQLDDANALLEEVKQQCLYGEDDGTTGVTDEPYIPPELFARMCAHLKGRKA